MRPIGEFSSWLILIPLRVNEREGFMQVNKNNITQFLTATNMSFMIPVYQ